KDGNGHRFLFPETLAWHKHKLLKLASVVDGEEQCTYVHNSLQLFEQHMFDSYGVEGTGEVAVMEFFGMKDPRTRHQYLSIVQLCRTVIQELCNTMQGYMDRQRELVNLIVQRKARTPQRKLLGVYIHSF